MSEFLSGMDAQGRVGGVSLVDLVAEFGSPLYVYDGDAIRAQFRAYLAHGLPRELQLHFAMKANSNLAILRLLAAEGAGCDIVSGGELARVLQAGGDAAQVVFSGVAKSDAEMQAALAAGIGCFNVESAAELQCLAEVATAMGKVAPVALRVNPDVDAKTHPYISTGMRENKFGVALEDAPALYRWAAVQPSLRVVGVGCHIGSQIRSLAPFLEAADSVLALADALVAEGIALGHVDLGGGLGIETADDFMALTPADLSRTLLERVGERPLRLHLQPGRSLVGNAGLLLSQVVFRKSQSGRDFLMLDAAMNDYVRPALYQVRPSLVNVSRPYDGVSRMDVVGPVCESGDTFARDFPICGERGDVVVIPGTGAYGFSMASNYNSRPRPAEVLIEGGQARLIRRRETFADLWAQEVL